MSVWRRTDTELQKSWRPRSGSCWVWFAFHSSRLWCHRDGKSDAHIRNSSRQGRSNPIELMQGLHRDWIFRKPNVCTRSDVANFRAHFCALPTFGSLAARRGSLGGQDNTKFKARALISLGPKAHIFLWKKTSRSNCHSYRYAWRRPNLSSLDLRFHHHGILDSTFSRALATLLQTMQMSSGEFFYDFQ